MFVVLRLCKEKEYNELTDYLYRAVDNLAKSGADFAVLSANTPHIVFDRLQTLSPIPLISIVESSCKEAEKRGYKKIGLPGTVFTVTEEFFKKPFADKNIEIVVPTDSEIEFVDNKIATELERGILRKETYAAFSKIINRMRAEENIEGIILGCTELPLLLNDENCPVPCLDTMQIHVKDIIDEILS